MFSDHLRQMNTGNKSVAGKLLLAVGGLAIVGQLGAVAMVADGQVKKAELRASQAASEQLAVRHCLESSVGITRHSCMLQARSGGAGGVAMAASLDPSVSAISDAAYSPGAAGMVPAGVQTLMPVNFMAH